MAALTGGLLAAPLAVEAQQTVKARRIGFLWGLSITPEGSGAFEQGLRQLGWVKGQNISIEYRSADGDLNRLPALAGELASLRLETLVTLSAPGTAAARRVAPGIPIVFAIQVEWKGAERRENVDPFTAQELRAIFAAADEVNWNFGTMLRLWAGCGARAGEVSALQWQDLDPHNGTVLIRRTFSHHRVLAWTKTGRERVSNFLPPSGERRRRLATGRHGAAGPAC